MLLETSVLRSPQRNCLRLLRVEFLSVPIPDLLLSLIENSAENPEVRMAAITALTYCSPSTADLQKLAVRTWFEPSRQVASYIHSTLKTLSQLSGSVPEY